MMIFTCAALIRASHARPPLVVARRHRYHPHLLEQEPPGWLAAAALLLLALALLALSVAALTC